MLAPLPGSATHVHARQQWAWHSTLYMCSICMGGAAGWRLDGRRAYVFQRAASAPSLDANGRTAARTPSLHCLRVGHGTSSTQAEPQNAGKAQDLSNRSACETGREHGLVQLVVRSTYRAVPKIRGRQLACICRHANSPTLHEFSPQAVSAQEWLDAVLG